MADSERITITPINSLPVEILLEIIKSSILPPRPHPLLALCLVSKQFRQLAQPLLLSHISICAFSRNVRKQCAQLKALSNGKSRAIYLTRTLTIDFRSSFDEGKSAITLKNALTKNLERAIRSLKNVNRVIWKVGQGDPSWTFELILKGLSSIPLQDIHVIISQRDIPLLRLGALSNLQRICLEWKRPYYSRSTELSSELDQLIGRCPNLSSLEIDARWMHFPRFFQSTVTHHSLEQLSLIEVEVSPGYITQNLHYLRHLKTFGLRRNVLQFESDSGRITKNISNGQIWSIFEKQKIKLKGIITDSVHDHSLTSYLSSYQGLECLTLYLGKPLAALVEPDHLLLSRLFAALASHHADSLFDLDLLAETSAEEEAFWPFQEEILDILPAFSNLRGFGVTEWGATSFQSVAAVQESIKSLFSACTNNFPKLKRLNIHPAGDVFTRDFERRPHRKYLADTVLAQTVREAVRTYPHDIDYPRPSFPITVQETTFFPSIRSDPGQFLFLY